MDAAFSVALSPSTGPARFSLAILRMGIIICYSLCREARAIRTTIDGLTSSLNPTGFITQLVSYTHAGLALTTLSVPLVYTTRNINPGKA